MLEGILSIAGKGGLFKLVSQGNNIIIVESVADKKRMPIHSTARVSALQDITMYGTDDDVKLSHVMANIFKLTGGKNCGLSQNSSSDDLKAFMDKALPTWDKERIYTSDIKKLVTWYNLLVENGLVSDKEDDDDATDDAKAEK